MRGLSDKQISCRKLKATVFAFRSGTVERHCVFVCITQQVHDSYTSQHGLYERRVHLSLVFRAITIEHTHHDDLAALWLNVSYENERPDELSLTSRFRYPADS